MKQNENKKLHCQIFNLGPAQKANYSVIQVLKYFRKSWKKCKWKIVKPKSIHKESKLLKLNSSKAKKKLNWKTKLSFRETIEMTSMWYKMYYDKKKISEITLNQIKKFEKKL